jgi:hypothetical protein
MTTLADLTDVQRRILRTAYECDKATFNGKQRRPIDRLHALGLIEREIVFVPGRPTPRGHHEIAVVITPNGHRLWRLRQHADRESRAGST